MAALSILPASWLFLGSLLFLTKRATAFAPRIKIGFEHPCLHKNISKENTKIQCPTILQAELPSSSPSSQEAVDYDFSSVYYWENFYKKMVKDQQHQKEKEQQLGEEPTAIIKDDGSDTSNTTTDSSTSDPTFCFEWHDSIDLELLASLIPPQTKCLMVGCGNSLLPKVVLDRKSNISLSLLDTSQTCLDQLKLQYTTSHPNDQLSYICGSATEMSKYFLAAGPRSDDSSSISDDSNNLSPSPYFDVIFDKGLVDAFMCGEGWEGPVESLLRESARLIDPKRGGYYVLVSYKLQESVEVEFQELVDKVVTDILMDNTTNDENESQIQLEWTWNFDIDELSNERVSVSIGTIQPKLLA